MTRSGVEYRTWYDMMRRCYSPKCKSYKSHGAKGIRVIKRWHRYENFRKDMGKRPLNKTLDRWPNNRGNYGPSNCRWATRLQQTRNQTGNIKIGHRLLLDVARENNISPQCCWARLKRGWSKHDAATTPIDRRRFPLPVST